MLENSNSKAFDFDSFHEHLNKLDDEEKFDEGINILKDQLYENKIIEKDPYMDLYCLTRLTEFQWFKYLNFEYPDDGPFEDYLELYISFLTSFQDYILCYYSYSKEYTESTEESMSADLEMIQFFKDNLLDETKHFIDLSKTIDFFLFLDHDPKQYLLMLRSLSKVFILLGEYQTAQRIIDCGIDIIIDFEKVHNDVSDELQHFLNISFARFNMLMGETLAYQSDFEKALAYFSTAIEWEREKEAAKYQKDMYDYCQKELNKVIINKPYQDRRVLLIAEGYKTNDSKSMLVVNPKYLPENITFPVGHPIVNHLYIGHPLEPSAYFPLDSYQLELVRDRLFEFCHLVQSLGATDINIEVLDANYSDNSSTSSNNVSGSAGFKVVKANASYSEQQSNQLINSLKQSIRLSQHFSPNSEPVIPDNLKWYNYEPSWKKLCEQRLKGNLLYHEEYIETSKSQMLDSQELTKLEVDVKAFFVKTGINYNESLNKKFQEQKNAILSIKVNFAPLKSTRQKSYNRITDNGKTSSDDNQPACTPKLSSEETEYIEIFREMVGNSEEISPRIRKVLDREAEHLGLSSERIKALENMNK